MPSEPATPAIGHGNARRSHDVAGRRAAAPARTARAFSVVVPPVRLRPGIRVLRPSQASLRASRRHAASPPAFPARTAGAGAAPIALRAPVCAATRSLDDAVRTVRRLPDVQSPAPPTGRPAPARPGGSNLGPETGSAAGGAFPEGQACPTR
jgi:hypothetical protein